MTPDLQPVTFAAPPVNEVALAVQFAEDIIDLQALGMIAGALGDQFPTQQQQPPLPRMDEPIGTIDPSRIELQFGAPPFPRAWFLSNDGHDLVQVQADRLVLNWRRLDGDQEYPRYTSLRDRLVTLLGTLREILDSLGRADSTVNFCEVTYINEVAVPGVGPGEPHPDLGQILNFVAPIRGTEFLPRSEDAQFQARWRIPDDALPNNSGVARLYLAVNPGFRTATQLPIYAMNLTARLVPPGGTSLLDSVAFTDIGHEWIVRGFADITTADMHTEWGAP